MKVFKAMRWTTLIAGILLVLLGVVSLFTPMQNLVWLGVVIGIAVLVSGITDLAHYFSTDKSERSGWALAEAIISSLIGVWMVFGSGSGLLTLIIPYIFAAFVLCLGITRIAEAITLRRLGAPRWGWLLALGIVVAVLGVLLFFAPLISASFVSVALSLLILTYGISNITLYVSMRRAGKYIRNRLSDLFPHFIGENEYDHVQ